MPATPRPSALQQTPARTPVQHTLEDIMATRSADPDDARQRPRVFRLSAQSPEPEDPVELAVAQDGSAPGPAESDDEGTEARGRDERMPTVWRGRRRWLLVLLLLLGVFQAAMALVMAFTVDALLGGPAQLNQALRSGVGPDGQALDPAALAQMGTYIPWPQLALLAGAVLSLGAARWAERVVAEDLGQDYVFEQRRRLIGSALAGAGNPSLGVTITRASNDLTAVRNWISQGLVPLVTAVPLIAVVVAVLTLSTPLVGAAVGAPILLLVVLLPPLAKATFERARHLRRRRGRMSARIADTVQAGESIQAAGGVKRELNALDRDSGKVVGAAVARAKVTGLVRALAITAAALSTAAVVTLGALGMVDAAGVASALTLVGVMAAPLGELGRVVEYRQNYKAARRIQAPLLSQADRLQEDERLREQAWNEVPRQREVTGRHGLRISRMCVDGQRAPLLAARAGERILVHSHDPGRIQPFLAALLAGQNTPGPEGHEVPELVMMVDGYDYTRAPGRQRRRLLGHASARIPLERGSVSRSITYRHPSADEEQMLRALDRVGLVETVEALRNGTGTRLKNGGQPLSASQRARLKLGRALMDDPPLLVLDGIDADLDAAGIDLLREELADYPGVVLFTSSAPEAIAPGHRVWTIDAP